MTKKEQKTRAAIVAEAKTWLATPYHHRAAIKGAGVDCAQILIEVFSAVGIVEKFDTGDYPPDWMMHRSEERYLAWVEQYADEVELPLPGDLAIWKIGRCFSHGAIVINWPEIIHAYRQEGCVIARGDTGEFIDRELKFYRVKGVK